MASLPSKLRNLPSLQSFKLQTGVVNHQSGVLPYKNDGGGGGVLVGPFRGLNLWIGTA